MKSHNLDRTGGWERHLPYFAYNLGAMQGWVNQDSVLPRAKFDNNPDYEFVYRAFVQDLYDDDMVESAPIAPALGFKWEIDGTNTPSQEGAQQLQGTDDLVRNWDMNTKFKDSFDSAF